MHWIYKTTLVGLAFGASFIVAYAKIGDGPDCESGDCKNRLEDYTSAKPFDMSSYLVVKGETTRSLRRKRSFNIPNPSKLDLALIWTIPVSTDPKGLKSFVLETDFSFNLMNFNDQKTTTTTTTTTRAPTTTTRPSSSSSYTSYANKRIETHPAEISRHDFYRHMESFLDRRGYNGKECTLRTLCELAEAPFDHGIYGELINLVMSASLNPTKMGGYDKYMTAEYYGKHYGECGKIYPKCPDSVLDLFSTTY